MLHELHLSVDEQKHDNYCNFSHLQSIISEMPPRDAVLEDGVRDELMDHVRGLHSLLPLVKGIVIGGDLNTNKDQSLFVVNRPWIFCPPLASRIAFQFQHPSLTGLPTPVTGNTRTLLSITSFRGAWNNLDAESRKPRYQTIFPSPVISKLSLCRPKTKSGFIACLLNNQNQQRLRGSV